jgi:hypothetical protein
VATGRASVGKTISAQTGDISLRDFDSLPQQEILALAISLEEEDERIYSDFGESLRENFPDTRVFRL